MSVFRSKLNIDNIKFVLIGIAFSIIVILMLLFYNFIQINTFGHNSDITLFFSGLVAISTAVNTVLVYYAYKQSKVSESSLKVANDVYNLSNRQLLLNYNPTIGIIFNDVVYKNEQIEVNEKRENSQELDFDVNVVNVGNAAAIAIVCDLEIILQFTNIKGEKVIPNLDESILIPYLQVGEVYQRKHLDDIVYGFPFQEMIDIMFEEGEKCEKYNREHENNEQYNDVCPILKLYAYYQNSLGQNFESIMESQVYFSEDTYDKKTKKIIKQRNVGVLVPPKFEIKIITREEMEAERNNRRKLRDKIYLQK